MKKYWFHLVTALVLFTIMALHATRQVPIPLFEEVEEYLYDARLRYTMPNTVDERIVILDLDERSLAAEGHWPWQRDKLADLVNILFDDYEIRVLAFDILFAEANETSALQVIRDLKQLPESQTLPIDWAELEYNWQTDSLFAESVIARDVIFGYVFKPVVRENEAETSGSLPIPALFADQLAAENIDIPFYEAAGYVGAFTELQDASEFGAFFSYPRLDDVTRISPLLETYQGDVYESLGLAMARLYLGNPPIQFSFAKGEEKTGLNLEALIVGDKKIPVDEKVQVYIPFRGEQGSFPYVSATDVLNGRVTKERLQDKLVMMGTSAAGLLDLRATPVGEAYVGAEVHANIASAILDERFMSSPPYMLGIELVLLLINVTLLALLIPFLSAVGAGLTVVGLTIGNIVLNFYFWNAQQLILPLASILVLIGAMAFLQITYDYFVESRRKDRLGRLFGQYIPAELVEEMDASGEELSLEGENREMSVLFSDVRGFTTISEGLDPIELTRLMNAFLTPITRIIHDNRGTIDKYMGDAVMAFWGAPLTDEQHAHHATIAALEMIEEMKIVTREFAECGWPPIKVGIGIASGPMNVGNMGSSFRMAYTVMGDTVNLGSRLEGMTKMYGANLIVAEETKAMIPGFTTRELDTLRVKGKMVPITVFEPMCEEQDASLELLAEIDEFHKGLACYRSQSWDDAENVFVALQQANPCILYELYLERVTAFKADPPGDDWDGVFVATSK